MKKLPSHTFTPLWMILVILTCVFSRGNGTTALVSSAYALSPSSVPFDFGNQTFRLDHEILHFSNGFYRSPNGQHLAYLTDRGVNQSITRAAAILIDNPAGSGIFSYVVGAARIDGREMYSTPVFLGDRIKIEAVRVSKTTVTVSYLDHPAGFPLATPPTKPVTVTYVIQDNGNLHAA